MFSRGVNASSNTRFSVVRGSFGLRRYRAAIVADLSGPVIDALGLMAHYAPVMCFCIAGKDDQITIRFVGRLRDRARVTASQLHRAAAKRRIKRR